MEFLEMQLGSVALMLAETIVRETRAKFPHQGVARHFCDHARRRDAQAQAIAIDDRGLREWERENRQTIDQHMLGRNRKACDRDRIASCEARRILIRSISTESTIPTAQTISEWFVR